MKFYHLLPAVVCSLAFVACESTEAPVPTPSAAVVVTPVPATVPTKTDVKKAATKASIKKVAAPKSVKKTAAPHTETIKKAQRIISMETVVS